MLRNTLFAAVFIVFGQKCNHCYSFAPKIVQQHVEQIKRIPKGEVEKPIILEPLKDDYWKVGYWSYGFRLWWLLPVEELQALAYFSDAITGKGQNYDDVLHYLTRILSNGESCQVRKHLIHYRTYWNNPDHAGSLDELYKLAKREPGYDCEPPDGCAIMHPRRLLNIIRAQVRQNTLGEDVTYDWLDDGLKNDMKNGLKVLRSLYEIDNAAQQLHNCAVSYAHDVETMKSILVLLVDENDNNKALAMGEYKIDSQQWSQISGVCNKQPSDEVIDKFHKYGHQTIHTWNTNKTYSSKEKEG